MTMPKKMKTPKPLPSALTVARPGRLSDDIPQRQPDRTPSVPSPQSRRLAAQAKRTAKPVGPPKPKPVARKSTSRNSASPPALPGTVPVTFGIVDAHATRVALSGDFNQWSPGATLLTKRGDGSWQTSVALPAGRYEYKFVVDGQWRFDPNAHEQVADGHGALNSVIEVRA
jgi:hypothetical protein